MRISLLRTGSVTALAVTATTLLALPPANAATGAGEGSAYGASVDVRLLPGVTDPEGVTINTGELAASRTTGPTSAAIVKVPAAPVLNASAVRSESRHSTATGKVHSAASIADAELPVLRSALDTRTPGAKLIRSSCTSTANGVTGDAELLDLDLGRLGNFPVHPEPNKVLEIPNLLKVTANEQIRHSDGSLTVNALHIEALNGAAEKLGHVDIVLSSSTCGKATSHQPPTTPVHPPNTGNPPPPHHPTTPGGGQVSVIPSGAPETGDGSLAGLREG